MKNIEMQVIVIYQLNKFSKLFHYDILAKKLRNGKVFCLDLSEEMLRCLKRKAEKKGLKDRVVVLKAEASSTGLSDEFADLIISNFVFHELLNPEKVLVEMHRILKTDGWIVITDFRIDTWIGKRIAASHKGKGHGPFGASELEAIYVKAGIKNVEVSPIKNFILGVGKK